MSTDHWRRDIPQCRNIWDLGMSTLTEPALLHGSEGVVLSHDPQSGSTTYLAKVQPGWSRRETAEEATIEIFLLEGDLTAAGKTVGSAGFASLPQGLTGDVELSSARGFCALVYWNPNMPTFPPPYVGVRVTRGWDEPARQRTPGSLDQVYRSLRLPDFVGDGFNGGPGGMLRMSTLGPGMTSPYQHVHHECWEEAVVLTGDVFLADRGLLGPGSYIAFPQEFWHAVLATQGGAQMIVHSNSPMGYPWVLRDYPLGQRMVDDYLDTMPLARPVKHTPWAETHYPEWQKSPEFQAWLASDAAKPWASEEARGAASAYRSTWKKGA